jgi:excisionase family DNA binding protein
MTSPATDSDPYWTVAEIATRLRVSKMTVYRLAETEAFPGTLRIGRTYRIPDSGLQTYLATCRVDSAASTP